jgi:hypothetical protein
VIPGLPNLHLDSRAGREQSLARSRIIASRRGSVLAELTTGRPQTFDATHPLGPGNLLGVAFDKSIYPRASMTRRSGVPRKSLGIRRLAKLLCGRALAGRRANAWKAESKLCFLFSSSSNFSGRISFGRRFSRYKPSVSQSGGLASSEDVFFMVYRGCGDQQASGESLVDR